MQVVWFKRDLRVNDHQALAQAAKHGPFIALYILEPDLWQQPDLSRRQYDFLRESLHDLKAQLLQVHCSLIIRVGRAVDVLQSLIAEYNVSAVLSHQETWNGWTYRRDIAVKRLLNQLNVTWHEYKQFGVIRGLNDRDGWARRWYHWVNQSIELCRDALQSVSIPSDELPNPEVLGLGEDDCPYRQVGGREQGLTYLTSFFQERGLHYTKSMSSPVTAFEACSRLSPYIAFGCLSIREIYQWHQKQLDLIEHCPPQEQRLWRSAHRSFSGRLRWHCHFIQKLEDQPSIEFENLHPAYDSVRTEAFNEEFFLAWQDGKTGFPMIDACMRALRSCGWINFRMRAMLMSFASYHLWLDWRRTAPFLAQQFTDYEPGIHYSQVQMQSGTTGINAIRAYNPIKQGLDHDPDARFIARWLPELASLPQKDRHQPWALHVPDVDYPLPIVDEKIARTRATRQLYAIRQGSQHRALSQAIVKKHASRRPAHDRRRRKKPPADDMQQELPL